MPRAQSNHTAGARRPGRSETDAAAAAVPPDADPAQRRLPPLLRRAWYCLNQAFRRRVTHLNITPDQFTILRWLMESDAKGPTQRELGTLMSSDANTIASLLSRMEEGSLIERVPHESDRRANRVRLKPLGRRVHRKAQKIAQDLQANVLSALPPGDREQFLTQLETLADACRDAADDS